MKCGWWTVIPALSIVMSSVAVSPGSATVQDALLGQVVDRTKRPLPFVVVTSRTRNGFLSYYTDLDGRFDFTGRPHRRGDAIDIRSVGFSAQSIRLDGVSRQILVTMDSAPGLNTTEWSIGLVIHARLAVVSDLGAPVDPLALQVGQHYSFRVVSRGRKGCFQAGPVASRVDGTHATVAVAEFFRARDCEASMVDHDQSVDLLFEREGVGRIRLIGRYADVDLPIVVRAAAPSNP